MAKYILKRILILIPTIIGVSFIVFLLLYLSPGDAALAKAGANAPQSAIDAIRVQMGLNDPFIVQYGRYLKGIVMGFNLGNSYITNAPVTAMILSVLPNTLKLTFLSLIVAMVFGITFGVISAIKKNTVIDNITMFVGMIGLAMPIFWTGILLILFFSVRLRILPSSGFGTFKQMILPSLALGFQSSAVIMRMTRSSMIDVLDSDYIRTARAKGLREKKVILIHTLKNAMIPIITVIGLQVGALLAGSVLTETIFSIPGVGRLIVESIKTRDYPVVLGCVMFIAICYNVISIVVDILYSYIDPKVKTSIK